MIQVLLYLPGRINLTAVCISLDDNVDFLLYAAKRPASLAIRSNVSLIKLFIILIARLLIPISIVYSMYVLQYKIEYSHVSIFVYCHSSCTMLQTE